MRYLLVLCLLAGCVDAPEPMVNEIDCSSLEPLQRYVLDATADGFVDACEGADYPFYQFTPVPGDSCHYDAAVELANELMSPGSIVTVVPRLGGTSFIVNDGSVASSMIEAGLGFYECEEFAFPCPGFKSAQERAEANGVGFWGECPATAP